MGRIAEKTPSNSPSMGRIERMVEELCPEGVPMVKLGDISLKVCSGGTPSRNVQEYFTGDIPWMRTQEVNWCDVYDTEIKITEDAVANSSAKIIPANCVIIAMYGATAGKSCINKIPLTTNQACCNLQIDPSKALYRYVYHWVRNEYERIKAQGEGSQNNINAQKVRTYPIPLPPLPIQEAIVEILDKFDRLSAELQAELQARKQQYEYYRNQLLTRFAPEQPVTEYSLGELCQLSRGKRLVKEQLSQSEGFPVYQNSITPLGYHTESNCDAGTTIVIGAGAAGDVTYVNETFWAADDCYYFICPNNVKNKYIYYFLGAKQTLLKSKVRKASIPRLARIEIEKIRIPLPSLEEQARIVAILDKFEALVNDLSQGLPAEIAAVQEQYEYYRNKLLTFKTKE